MLRRQAQHALQRFLGRPVLALREVQQGLQIRHGYTVRPSLARRIDISLGGLDFLVADFDIRLVDMRRTVIRLQRQHLVVSRQRGLVLMFGAQQAALEQPHLRIVWIALHRLFGVAVSGRGIVLQQRMAGQAQQGARIIRLGLERQLQRLPGLVRLIQRQIGFPAQRQDFRLALG